MVFDREWTYTAAVLDARKKAASGGLRERIRFDLEGRPPYAWGLITAADAAGYAGISRFTAIEFGVARAHGLLELCRLAKLVTEETGVAIDIAGFDSGQGLPLPQGFRDHPEIWGSGDYSMGAVEKLRDQLPDNVRLILGDIADTVGPFIDNQTGESPIGFCIFDTDYWSSTNFALKIYDGSARLYLPVGLSYFDDTLGGARNFGALFRTSKAGQLLSISEFNSARPNRALESIRVLRYRRPLFHEQWIEQVYAVHVLDHSFRNGTGMAGGHDRDPAWRKWPL
jgi:hypothetical protein